MEAGEIYLYNTLRGKLGDQETQDLIKYVKSAAKNEFMEREEKFLTKDDKNEITLMMKEDKVELIRAIYIVGIVQYVAIMGSLIGILSFMLKD